MTAYVVTAEKSADRYIFNFTPTGSSITPELQKKLENFHLKLAGYRLDSGGGSIKISISKYSCKDPDAVLKKFQDLPDVTLDPGVEKILNECHMDGRVEILACSMDPAPKPTCPMNT